MSLGYAGVQRPIRFSSLRSPWRAAFNTAGSLAAGVYSAYKTAGMVHRYARSWKGRAGRYAKTRRIQKATARPRIWRSTRGKQLWGARRKTRNRRAGGFLTLVPAKKFLKMCSMQRLTLGNASNSIDSEIIQANSIFAVNNTQSNLQPFGYDQMLPFYDNYMVHACKVTAIFENLAAKKVFGLLYVDETNTSIDSTTLTLVPLNTLQCNKKRVFTRMIDDVTPTGSQMNRARISMFRKTKRVLPNSAKNDMQSLFSSSPAQGWFIHVGVATEDGTAQEASKYIVNLTIHQWVTWFNRKQIPISIS